MDFPLSKKVKSTQQPNINLNFKSNKKKKT